MSNVDNKTWGTFVSVSYIYNGYWSGNGSEHVAPGTGLGSGCTKKIYTPSSDKMTAKYDVENDTWIEIINNMAIDFYDDSGCLCRVDFPDSDFPEWAIFEAPMDFNAETETVKYENGEWIKYEILIGKKYWDSDAVEHLVSDFNFVLPNGCTFKAPPDLVENQLAVLSNDEWMIVADFRGTEYWDADGTKHTISELGVEVPKEALLEAPVIPPSTEELAAQARAKRDALVDQVTREINRLEDAGKDAKAWRDYRIVLRNVPEQAGFPKEIDWGKQPAAFTGK